MTAHDHREFVEGCYRCDLSRDEVSEYTPDPQTESTNDAQVVASSVAGLAALRAGARRAGLEYGQSRPEDAYRKVPAFEFDEGQVNAAAVVVAQITGEPLPGRFERTMARAILQAAADIDTPDRENGSER